MGMMFGPKEAQQFHIVAVCKTEDIEVTSYYFSIFSRVVFRSALNIWFAVFIVK